MRTYDFRLTLTNLENINIWIKQNGHRTTDRTRLADYDGKRHIRNNDQQFRIRLISIPKTTRFINSYVLNCEHKLFHIQGVQLNGLNFGIRNSVKLNGLFCLTLFYLNNTYVQIPNFSMLLQETQVKSCTVNNFKISPVNRRRWFYIHIYISSRTRFTFPKSTTFKMKICINQNTISNTQI